MVKTSKNTTEQLLMDRRKHIKRTLDIKATQGNNTFTIPTEKIVKDSFKYSEKGPSNTEGLFGICANPVLEVSLYDIELETGDILTVNFVLDNLVDNITNDNVPIGIFVIDKVTKDTASNIYNYVAYNHMVDVAYPNNFDKWKFETFASPNQNAYCPMTFGILNSRCGIDNYLENYREVGNSVVANTFNLNMGVATGSLEGRILLECLAISETFSVNNKTGFYNYKRSYRFNRNGWRKSYEYIDAMNLLQKGSNVPQKWKNDMVPFVLYGLSPSVGNIGSNNIIGFSSYSTYNLTQELEDLYLYFDSLRNGFDFNVVILPTKVKRVSSESGTLYEEFRLLEFGSQALLSCAEGYGSNADTIVLKLPCSQTKQSQSGVYVVGNQFSSLDLKQCLDNAYEILGKTTKPARYEKGFLEVNDIKDYSYRLYPKNNLFPNEEYPHITIQRYTDEEYHTNVHYGVETCAEFEYDSKNYKYSGIRFKWNASSEMSDKNEFTYFFNNDFYAPDHLYDLTKNNIFVNGPWSKQEVITLIEQLAYKLGYADVKKAVNNIRISAPANVMLELNDKVNIKKYRSGNNEEIQTPITEMTIRGEQFAFQEIVSEHINANIQEKDWKLDKDLYLYY